MYSSLFCNGQKTENPNVPLQVNRQILLFHTREYFVTQRNTKKLMMHTRTLMNLKNVMLSERNKKKMYIVYDSIYIIAF